jgi:signal transduction histidine kinase
VILEKVKVININLDKDRIEIGFLKDTLQVLEDKRMPDEIAQLKRKLESLATAVLSMNHMEGETTNTKSNNIDLSKYLEISLFSEFQKSYNRELDGIKRTSEDIRRNIDEILNILRTKAGEKDLKNLEDILLAKMEELKINSARKFADKTDTQKNVKYLDTQIKYIIDVYIKKMEKGDNWLLAKKPVNGYNCASCESYIGDLHDNTQYVAWNKYPARENEKGYRVDIVNIDR